MSEQTPNSSEGLSGAEPSMEDILASIRKIISDDEPVAMESPEDVPAIGTSVPAKLDDLMQGIQADSTDIPSDAVLDAKRAQSDPFAAEGESVDLNIEEVLSGLDDDGLGDEGFSPAPEDVHFDELTLETDDDDILSFLDADIPMADDLSAESDQFSAKSEIAPLAAMAAASVAIPETTPEKITAEDDFEMDALLDDILMSPEQAAPEDDFGDDFEDDIFEVANNDEDLEPAATDFDEDLEEVSDLDLVKSLMADLADDPGSFETEDDLDALLAIPEVEGEFDAQNELDVEDQLETLVEELQASEVADMEAAELEVAETDAVLPYEEARVEDILGDILDMTLEDELRSHPDEIDMDDVPSMDSIYEAELDNIAEIEASEDDLPSLSEIAAAAEADAVAVETASAPQAVAASAGLAAAIGGAALGASTLGLKSAEPETEITDNNSELTEISTDPHFTTQETSMPVQAVKTDAILDDVTETATAGAFAQLNQVVEDKATFNERGPRIGDLVQDALRPMLKEWLDANLKGIVERAVTKEVKRISSGK